jgi:hypothetical protein
MANLSRLFTIDVHVSLRPIFVRRQFLAHKTPFRRLFLLLLLVVPLILVLLFLLPLLLLLLGLLLLDLGHHLLCRLVHGALTLLAFELGNGVVGDIFYAGFVEL